jgi:hypothetical protein
MNLLLRAAALTIALTLLAACASVTTVNPIGVSKGEVSDDRLMGSWKFIPSSKDVKGEAYAFLLARETGGISGLVVISSENEWWEADLVAGKAGDHSLLNVRPLKKNGVDVEGGDKIEGYFPLRYSVGADGNITLFIWSPDAMKDAVQQGRIAGRASTTDIVLTAKPDELDAFFANMAPVIFSEPYATLERVK